MFGRHYTAQPHVCLIVYRRRLTLNLNVLCGHSGLQILGEIQ
uniref:Uncharacterized protein n=1 Tax=Anguilla anguilla TaxID=7936 RepID=A0A0E9WHB0_ANGAN